MINPIYLFSAVAWFSMHMTYAQPCSWPEILITRQTQIDSFELLYPNCQVISGSLIIDGNDINDLTGLAQIDSILGDLIIRNTTNLTDLTGLSQLDYIGGDFSIRQNMGLLHCTGVDSLKAMGGRLSIIHNAVLSTLAGFTSLQTLGDGLGIGSNPNLISLEGLSALQSIGRNLILDSLPRLKSLAGLDRIATLKDVNRIWVLDSLEHLHGLHHLFDIRGSLLIGEVPRLKGFDGLERLAVVYGVLRLRGLPADSLTGFPLLQTINSDLEIYFNKNLQDFNWFPVLDSIRGVVLIHDNEGSINLEGFEFLRSAGGLVIENNRGLQNLEGMQNLTHLYGGLSIEKNDDLIDLSDLSGLMHVDNFVSIRSNQVLTGLLGLDMIEPYMVHQLIIENNDELTYCSVPFVCEFLAIGGNVSITGNNPGCNTEIEVRQACFTASKDAPDFNTPDVVWDVKNKTIEIQNPANEILSLRLFDLMGRILHSENFEGHVHLGLQDILPGCYWLNIQSGTVYHTIQLSIPH